MATVSGRNLVRTSVRVLVPDVLDRSDRLEQPPLVYLLDEGPVQQLASHVDQRPVPGQLPLVIGREVIPMKVHIPGRKSAAIDFLGSVGTESGPLMMGSYGGLRLFVRPRLTFFVVDQAVVEGRVL